MGTHEGSQARQPQLIADDAALLRGRVHLALLGAVGGQYRPALFVTLSEVVLRTLEAGGPAAAAAFFAAATDAALLDAHGRPPADRAALDRPSRAPARARAPVPRKERP